MTCPLAIDRERAQLDLAFAPGRMGPMLARAFGVNGARRRPGGCHILDAKYVPRERCTLLYKLGDDLFLGTLRWDGASASGGHSEEHRSGGASGVHILEAGMHAYRFPDDPALPGLAVALDPTALGRVLEPIVDARVLRYAVTLLRYRPSRRATLRVELRTSGRPRRTLFAKVYHDLRKAVAVESTLRALADSPAVRDGRLVVVQPVAVLHSLRWVLFGAVGGFPLDRAFLFGRHAAKAVTAAAGALAALHRAGPLPARSWPASAAVARVARRAKRTAQVAPALGAEMAELAVALAARLPTDDEITLVHGDCKPSQFLVSRTGSSPALQVALLDFDSCGLADPASDVGAFMASLRLVRARPTGLGLDHLTTLRDDFLATYCAGTGRAMDFRVRVAWYEALALLRKAQRAFARAPRSPVPAAILAEARACLMQGVRH
jgi:aminoglycoside phosphotransferase (APT) family kinase protein